jgi:hypothetical protein
MTNYQKFEQKIRAYYNDYLDRNCNTNRKKLYALRVEIKDLQYIVDSNKDELKKSTWCWFYGEKYTQFDLQKDIRTIDILNKMYNELKK